MPSAPLRPCVGKPTCPNRVESGRCRDCSRVLEQQRPHLEARRWYRTARWRRVRLFVISRDPLCVECLKVDRVTATAEIDHIVPHRGDEQLFWDTDNLQGLCKPCHSSKTQRGQ